MFHGLALCSRLRSEPGNRNWLEGRAVPGQQEGAGRGGAAHAERARRVPPWRGRASCSLVMSEDTGGVDISDYYAVPLMQPGDRCIIQPGDRVVAISGSPLAMRGATSTLRLYKIGSSGEILDTQ